MMRLSLLLSLLTTRNSISPLRSSATAGYRGWSDPLDSHELESILHTFSGKGTTLGFPSASGVIVSEWEFLIRLLGLSLPK